MSKGHGIHALDQMQKNEHRWSPPKIMARFPIMIEGSKPPGILIQFACFVRDPAEYPRVKYLLLITEDVLFHEAPKAHYFSADLRQELVRQLSAAPFHWSPPFIDRVLGAAAAQERDFDTLAKSFNPPPPQERGHATADIRDLSDDREVRR